jgi:hypothetical protein
MMTRPPSLGKKIHVLAQRRTDRLEAPAPSATNTVAKAQGKEQRWQRIPRALCREARAVGTAAAEILDRHACHVAQIWRHQRQHARRQEGQGARPAMTVSSGMSAIVTKSGFPHCRRQQAMDGSGTENPAPDPISTCLNAAGSRQSRFCARKRDKLTPGALQTRRIDAPAPAQQIAWPHFVRVRRLPAEHPEKTLRKRMWFLQLTIDAVACLCSAPFDARREATCAQRCSGRA